jgi:uncharacterized membrane protein YozB (DUF420 family)
MADIAGQFAVGESSPQLATAATLTEARGADARFYLTMALISATIIFLGFSPSFYLRSVIHVPLPPLSLLTVTHGIVFTAWIATFVTQAALIATGKPSVHRRLGVVAGILFGAAVTLGFWTAITAGRLGHHPPGSPAPLAFMALPLFAIVAALLLVAGALWNRRNSAWHKRLMLASVFMMTGPGTGRIAIPLGLAPYGSQIAIVAAELLLVSSMIYDYRSHKRIHRAYWVAAAVFVTFHVAVTWAFDSPSWLALARSITEG